ncbi:four helix bundle protein [Parafilimonas terrae]|uniref:Four helix bundle protein n=1 Tax=Parafilimonas terrae TaxID=1465490 RepID=A0A1I5V4W7_9BACT|nr:four helix bundle protein [Parafilimonas terrae]SFQ02594.1 four helix bundle protein [Parafilimonas terrae]
MKENIVKQKSYAFAINIVLLCKDLQQTQKEFILSKQLLRSGTAVGALIREAVLAESKAGFIHKLSIVLKEGNETGYWLYLFKRYGIHYPGRLQFNNNGYKGIVPVIDKHN